jgi:hypothetical protein
MVVSVTPFPGGRTWAGDLSEDAWAGVADATVGAMSAARATLAAAAVSARMDLDIEIVLLLVMRCEQCRSAGTPRLLVSV